MVLYTGGQRGRLAGQAIVAEVEDAIDGHFKRGCGGGGDGGGGGRHGGGGTVRINRSRPVIPPLLELHLIQLGNKLTAGEAEVARVRFRRAAASTTNSSNNTQTTNGEPEHLASTDPEGNSVQGRPSSSSSPPRARCCNCPDSAPTDAVVEQLVRTMRKVVLDILEDNATSSLLRARVSRHRLSASVRDDRVRSSSSSSSGSSSSAGGCCTSSMSQVAVITPGSPPDLPPPDPPSVASSPSCSSPSSLFSSPSSTSSGCEARKEREGAGSPGMEEEEQSALRGGTELRSQGSPPPLSALPRPTPIEPIFLRCSRRPDHTLALAHALVRARDDGTQHGPRGPLSPSRRPDPQTLAGDELQIRLKAVLHSGPRPTPTPTPTPTPPRHPPSRLGEEEGVMWPLGEQCEVQEAPRVPENYDPWSQPDDWGRPAASSTPPPPPMVSPGILTQGDATPTYECDDPQVYPRPRCSIFTISGTLADPFGTSARYSLRSLSTAHL